MQSHPQPFGAPEREPTDAHLVPAARRGDVLAKELLFRRHVNMAFGMALRVLGRRQDVEDLVHESFMEALSSLHKLREDMHFGTWLGRIVINRTLKHRRRERLRQRLGLDASQSVDVSEFVSEAAPPDVLAELNAIYVRLSGLPERSRVALIMRRVEGRKMEEIAALMGVSLGTVKRLLTRAEDMLAKALAPTKRAQAGRASGRGDGA
ncbi:MAG: RNA polymerase sigma factor [Deltaproteobacteria bacterium]|nr:RNA polymerase sigma factor [Deltaproteobacteria bacterium]